MDDNERTLRIEEYKKLREQLISEMDMNTSIQNDDYGSGETSNKVKSLNNGHYKESKNPFDNFNDRKAGMVNVITLSIFTFVFECLFIFLSFVIFN